MRGHAAHDPAVAQASRWESLRERAMSFLVSMGDRMHARSPPESFDVGMPGDRGYKPAAAIACKRRPSCCSCLLRRGEPQASSPTSSEDLYYDRARSQSKREVSSQGFPRGETQTSFESTSQRGQRTGVDDGSSLVLEPFETPPLRSSLVDRLWSKWQEEIPDEEEAMEDDTPRDLLTELSGMEHSASPASMTADLPPSSPAGGIEGRADGAESAQTTHGTARSSICSAPPSSDDPDPERDPEGGGSPERAEGADHLSQVSENSETLRQLTRYSEETSEQPSGSIAAPCAGASVEGLGRSGALAASEERERHPSEQSTEDISVSGSSPPRDGILAAALPSTSWGDGTRRRIMSCMSIRGGGATAEGARPKAQARGAALSAPDLHLSWAEMASTSPGGARSTRSPNFASRSHGPPAAVVPVSPYWETGSEASTETATTAAPSDGTAAAADASTGIDRGSTVEGPMSANITDHLALPSISELPSEASDAPRIDRETGMPPPSELEVVESTRTKMATTKSLTGDGGRGRSHTSWASSFGSMSLVSKQSRRLVRGRSVPAKPEGETSLGLPAADQRAATSGVSDSDDRARGKGRRKRKEVVAESSGQASPASGSVTPSTIRASPRTVAAMLLGHRAGSVFSSAPAEPPSEGHESTEEALAVPVPSRRNSLGSDAARTNAQLSSLASPTIQPQAHSFIKDQVIESLRMPDGQLSEESELMEAPRPRPEERISRSMAGSSAAATPHVSDELTASSLLSFSFSTPDQEEERMLHNARTPVAIQLSRREPSDVSTTHGPQLSKALAVISTMDTAVEPQECVELQHFPGPFDTTPILSSTFQVFTSPAGVSPRGQKDRSTPSCPAAACADVASESHHAKSPASASVPSPKFFPGDRQKDINASQQKGRVLLSAAVECDSGGSTRECAPMPQPLLRSQLFRRSSTEPPELLSNLFTVEQNEQHSPSGPPHEPISAAPSEPRAPTPAALPAPNLGRDFKPAPDVPSVWPALLAPPLPLGLMEHHGATSSEPTWVIAVSTPHDGSQSAGANQPPTVCPQADQSISSHSAGFADHMSIASPHGRPVAGTGDLDTVQVSIASPADDCMAVLPDMWPAVEPSETKMQTPAFPSGCSPVEAVIEGPQLCPCGKTFLPDSAFCNKCGSKRPGEAPHVVTPLIAAEQPKPTTLAGLEGVGFIPLASWLEEKPLKRSRIIGMGDNGADESLHATLSPLSAKSEMLRHEEGTEQPTQLASDSAEQQGRDFVAGKVALISDVVEPVAVALAQQQAPQKPIAMMTKLQGHPPLESFRATQVRPWGSSSRMERNEDACQGHVAPVVHVSLRELMEANQPPRAQPSRVPPSHLHVPAPSSSAARAATTGRAQPHRGVSLRGRRSVAAGSRDVSRRAVTRMGGSCPPSSGASGGLIADASECLRLQVGLADYSHEGDVAAVLAWAGSGVGRARPLRGSPPHGRLSNSPPYGRRWNESCDASSVVSADGEDQHDLEGIQLGF